MDDDTAIAQAVADATSLAVADGIEIIYPTRGLSSRNAAQLVLVIDREREAGKTHVTAYVDKDLDRVLDKDEKNAGALFSFSFSDITGAFTAAQEAVKTKGIVT